MLLAPHFCTQSSQPPSPLAKSCLGQWHPGLIWRRLWDGRCSGCWSLSWQRRPYLRCVEGEPAQMSAPPSACMGWSGWMGMGIKMTALPVAHDLAVVPCFYGVLAFFCRLSQLLNSFSSCPFRLSSQPPAVSLPGSMSKPHFPAPLPSRQKTHDSGWAGQGCSRDHVHSSYFVMPFTDGPPYSPLILWRSLSVPQISPPWGDFLIKNLFSPSAFPQVAGPFLIFFFSFSLPHCEGIFLSFYVFRAFSNIQQVLCVRIVPFIDIFLMYWWGDMNSCILLSAHPDSSW